MTAEKGADEIAELPGVKAGLPELFPEDGEVRLGKGLGSGLQGQPRSVGVVAVVLVTTDAAVICRCFQYAGPGRSRLRDVLPRLEERPLRRMRPR